MKDLVDFLESSMFTLNILLDEVDRELGQKKRHFVGRCLYLSQITYTNDL